MEGYLQASIDRHYRRLEFLKDNQKYEQQIELNFINELEDMMEFYKKNKEEEIK